MSSHLCLICVGPDMDCFPLLATKSHLLVCYFHAAQLPQLMKILWGGSAEGLSLTSFLLQLYAFSSCLQRALLQLFISAWADRLFMLAPTAAIVFLILHYRGDTIQGEHRHLQILQKHSTKSSPTWHSFTKAVLPELIWWVYYLQALQLATNYRNGHTGQLSILSVLLSFAGSLAVAFVSLQVCTGNYPVSLSHILSACLSCVLLAQVLSSKTSTISTTKKTE
uniref:Uncharacterized protein n=1 Tax=Amphilophus citrinellus TaxID=61819 RepID=A0A3Q0QTX7_AMPCI